MSSYEFHPTSQIPAGEADRIFQAAFGYRTDGRFVEIGAFDGITYSHSWGLARLGWRGVYVEPIPELALECQKNHIKNQWVTVIRCACGAENGWQTLYMPGDRPWGATLEREIYHQPNEMMVPVRTLNDVLTFENIERGFEILTIDVEFAALQVLAGFDINHWQPKLIIIELHEKHDQIEFKHSTPARLHCDEEFPKAGYRKVYSDNTNSLFLHEG